MQTRLRTKYYILHITYYDITIVDRSTIIYRLYSIQVNWVALKTDDMLGQETSNIFRIDCYFPWQHITFSLHQMQYDHPELYLQVVDMINF